MNKTIYNLIEIKFLSQRKFGIRRIEMRLHNETQSVAIDIIKVLHMSTDFLFL